MKKILWIMAVALVVMPVTYLYALEADGHEKSGERESGMMMGKMMGGEGKGMGGGKMMGMMPMMKSVVATSDGGIVIVAGNKITKYDSDLNIVKEVELKMDKPPADKNQEEDKNEGSDEKKI